MIKRSLIATLLGIAAIVLISLYGVSLRSDDGAVGLFVRTITSTLEAVPGDRTPSREWIRAPLFQVTEANIRLVLALTSCASALTAGILSVTSARSEPESLWYTLAVFAGGSALAELSFGLGVAFLLLFSVAIQKARNWKMSRY